jgi:hypothetical protein
MGIGPGWAVPLPGLGCVPIYTPPTRVFLFVIFSALAHPTQKEKFINRKNSDEPTQKSIWLTGCQGVKIGLNAGLDTSPP